MCKEETVHRWMRLDLLMFSDEAKKVFFFLCWFVKVEASDE